MFYSKSLNAFSSTEDEVYTVSVSDTDYEALLLAQRVGAKIQASSSGAPEAISEFGAGSVIDLSTVTASSSFLPPVSLADTAAIALRTARTYVTNNYTMLNEPTPDNWVTYLKALMAIANGTDTTSTTLPTAPTS